MDSEEFEKLCNELRSQYRAVAKKEHPDATDEEIEDMCNAAIMGELWQMFLDGKIEDEDLVKMAGQLGFKPTEEFKEKTTPVAVEGEKEGSQVIPTDEGRDIEVSAEQLKEAQGYDDEEKERKEARKLFGFDDDEDEEEKEKEKE